MQNSPFVLKDRLLLGSEIIKHTVDFFHDEGFVQLLPVMLGKSTDPLGPDPNSSIIKTTEVEYLGDRFYTMNSMVLHKQVAVKEIGKIFILSPNIRLERAERHATGRHLFEFTQADFEIPMAKKADVMKLIERYFSTLSSFLSEESHVLNGHRKDLFEFEQPFKSYTTHELMDKYGEDWETRASLEHDQPFWVTCHKREFYDKEDEENPGHYLNYDLIYPMGYGEALSGAEREYDYRRIIKRMGRDRLNMDIYKSYIAEAEKSFIPSAGAGFGIERMIRFLSRAEHIGDVQLFRRVPGEQTAF